MPETDWFVAGPLLAQTVAALIAAERNRTGKPAAEIFADAGLKLMENEVKLLEDLARLEGAESDN